MGGSFPEQSDQVTIFVRDFTLPARIGIYPGEKAAPQRLRVSVEMQLCSAHPVREDDIAQTVSYEGIVGEIRRLAQIHHNLVESFAENLAAFALSDARVEGVRVRVEKPDIFSEGVAGVSIFRRRSDVSKDSGLFYL